MLTEWIDSKRKGGKRITEEQLEFTCEPHTHSHTHLHSLSLSNPRFSSETKSISFTAVGGEKPCFVFPPQTKPLERTLLGKNKFPHQKKSTRWDSSEDEIETDTHHSPTKKYRISIVPSPGSIFFFWSCRWRRDVLNLYEINQLYVRLRLLYLLIHPNPSQTWLPTSTTASTNPSTVVSLVSRLTTARKNAPLSPPA